MGSRLEDLESESIYILREVARRFEKPVMLYSIGKDSSVLLHLAKKAFYPNPLPFPLVHIDTEFKFKEMYEFRDQIARSKDVEVKVFKNTEAISEGTNPFSLGTYKCCGLLKTLALKRALHSLGTDVAVGGARRDEEKSRSKERIFSLRSEHAGWAPDNQRPEFWHHYNLAKTDQESFRAFPISNWTELDIWSYIYKENIEIVPLYYASLRPVIRMGRQLIPTEVIPQGKTAADIEMVNCRFRTLGCSPCTGAVESYATNTREIIQELLEAKNSERITRIIDYDQSSSMEKKKQEGYF